MTGAGSAGEPTFVDVRKRLAELVAKLAAREAAHRDHAERVAAEHGEK